MDRPPARAAHPRPDLVIPGIEDLVPVGHGGFGTVYRGHQAAFDRAVAVKVMSTAAGGGSSAARWRREVAAMGRLSNHPNIVAVYDGGVTEEGLPYLVMPFVPGGSLADVVRARGPLPHPEVAALGAKLAGALASAHDRGVLHRDVKPGNVLLSPYGEPQLTDFGIARIDDTTTTGVGTQALALTVAYAAPEVLNGEPATERSDVYSLAATLHLLLTGDPPFPARPDEPLVAFVVRITTDAPPDLRERGVPDALAQVIEAGLAKDPSARPDDARELQRRLEGVARRLGTGDDTVVQPLTVPTAVPTDERSTAGARTGSVTVPPPAPGPPPVVPGSRSADPPGPPAPAWRGVLLGILALLVVAVGGILLVASRDGDDDDPSAAPATSSAEPTVSSAAPTTSSDTTADTVASPGPADPADLDQLAVTYLETLAAGDLDGAFGMLSPAMQGSQPRASFDAFWGGLDSIEIVGEPQVDEEGAAVTVPVAFDGAREDYRLTFVTGDDGAWLVDGPRPG